MTLEEAMRQTGLYASVYLGNTKGYDVYSLYMRETALNPGGPIPHIGYPFVFVKGKGAGKVITGNDVFKWLEPFKQKEDAEEEDQ